MKSSNMATISLAVMGAGFAITLFLPDHLAILLLRGAFEAGLVGGIADWFAVTALFRHPLGLRIPHTSLLLKNRDKIVQSLISAMETELLNKKSIEEKLSSFAFIPAAAGWVTRMMRRRKTRERLLEQASVLLRRLPLERAVPPLQKALAGYAAEADLVSLAETALARLIKDGKDEAVFDYALERALEWGERSETKAMLGKLAAEKLAEVKLGGFKGVAFQAFIGFLDEEMLGDLLQNMLLSGIRDVRSEDGEYRSVIMREIRVSLFQVAGDEERLGQLREWATGVIQSDRTAGFLLERLEELRAKAEAILDEEQARGGRRVFGLYSRLLRRLAGEEEWAETAEQRIRGALIGFVEANHYRIGRLVKDNLDKMDDAALVDMLEGKIGKDLQWIRVNGALCGFLIGLVLTILGLLLGKG